MPSKSGILTPREIAFTAQMVRTNDPAYSAKKAGYPHPAQAASHNANNEALQAVIAAARDRLRGEGARIGVGVLIELATDTKAPPGVRRAASSDLVKFSGVAASDGEAEKGLHEMTSAELSELAGKLEQRRALILEHASGKAKPVAGEVIENAPEPPESGVFD